MERNFEFGVALLGLITASIELFRALIQLSVFNVENPIALIVSLILCVTVVIAFVVSVNPNKLLVDISMRDSNTVRGYFRNITDGKDAFGNNITVAIYGYKYNGKDSVVRLTQYSNYLSKFPNHVDLYFGKHGAVRTSNMTLCAESDLVKIDIIQNITTVFLAMYTIFVIATRFISEIGC